MTKTKLDDPRSLVFEAQKNLRDYQEVPDTETLQKILQIAQTGDIQHEIRVAALKILEIAGQVINLNPEAFHDESMQKAYQDIQDRWKILLQLAQKIDTDKPVVVDSLADLVQKMVQLYDTEKGEIYVDQKVQLVMEAIIDGRAVITNPDAGDMIAASALIHINNKTSSNISNLGRSILKEFLKGKIPVSEKQEKKISEALSSP